MQMHNVVQGSPEWLALRRDYLTASEAPAMMGCSPYQTRTELLAVKSGAVIKEPGDAAEYLFARGHEAEAQCRPIVESMIGEDLYPATCTETVDGLKLLASCDGLTMDGSTLWEHKLHSEDNANHILAHGEPPIHHVWQLEQQMLVTGATRALFSTSDGTSGKHANCWYTSKPERRAALIAGWKQFVADVSTYVHSTVEAAPVGKTLDTLPALHINLRGEVTTTNLPDFKSAALSVIRGVNRNLETDQDFADAEKAVKWCADVEDRIKEAKAKALAQTQSIDELYRALDEISAEARDVRLSLDKLVKTKKESIRADVVRMAQSKLAEHIASLDKRLGQRLMPVVQGDFAGAIKGKKTMASLRDAADTELARCKIMASEIADRIQANVNALKGEAHDWGFLFPDLAAVASKPIEDFANLLAARIASHKQAEDLRRQREAEAAAKAAQVLQQAAAPAVSKPAPVVTAEAPVVTNTTIKLGDINARLAPIQISQAGLAQLGFEPVGKDKAAVLYRESDFPRICSVMVRHLNASGALANT